MSDKLQIAEILGGKILSLLNNILLSRKLSDVNNTH